MLAASYRLCKETSVIYSQDGKLDLLRLPEGSIVTAVGEPSEETSMISVVWGTKLVRMFTVDLQHRGELVNGSAA